ncbi:MAG: hypothetical protein FWC57_00485, partial [Endomicrobia bacterium]|nr:hypothetical protein [Endomicrobiia bacterium]
MKSLLFILAVFCFGIVDLYAQSGPWSDFVNGEYKTAVSGSRIYLSSDTTAMVGDASPFGLPGNSGITIDGAGYKLDSSRIAGLGFVFNASSVTFRDITFEN